MEKNSLPTITIQRRLKNNQDSLQLYFKYNEQLLSIVRINGNFRWSKTLRCWHGPFTLENLNALRHLFQNVATLIEDESIYREPKRKEYREKSNLTNRHHATIATYQNYLVGKRYSPSTVSTYVSFLADFINHFHDKDINEINNRTVEVFIEEVFIPRRYSISTQRQFISAMKLFADLHPDCKLDKLKLERPKKSRYLPIVLSQQEVLEILRCTKNLKHRAILALIYSCGLRVGELIDLELSHIDIQRMQLAIHNGKGRKDRYVNMAESLVPLIKNYLNTYQPNKYFAEGKPSEKYSANSVRGFLKRSVKLANIDKDVTPHSFRHSYATHLLENGTDIRLIQTLLGHNRPETTMIYTHVSKSSLETINNPLDVAVRKYLKSDIGDDTLEIGSIVER